MEKSKSRTRKSRGDLDGKIAGLYDLEETIGKGHFAVVKLARHVFTNEKVAVKVIDKTKLDEVSKAHLFQEVRCMKLVQHPNVVRLYEVIDTQTRLYLILELGDGGDMYDYIMKHDGGLTEELARRYFKQIVEAISYCHKLHVVHRDLKPENVVFFEKLGIVKLTDFGFSNMFNPGKKLETSCGSLAYSAPEILLGDSYDAPAVDVWSLGVILFMLVCGEPPFQEANDSETLTMILDCKYSIPAHISANCKELICQMLMREPSNRAKLDEIVNHHWLRMGDYNPPAMPLISREHLSDEDHAYLIEKMVEGNIASKEEILQSLDKDLYNHITATYYLLAERKLKQHHHEHAAAMAQKRKQSVPIEHHHKPQLEPLALSPRPQTAHSIQQRERDKKEEQTRPKTSFVQSLLSPPGAHPTTSSTPGQRSLSPDMHSHVPRKYSLIQEESIDDDDDDDDDDYMDIDPSELRPAKSAESLDDNSTHKGSGHPLGFDAFHLKRPLVSVASSPQLLNQICEENESDVDEEDDFVPNKLSSPRLRLSRGSCASPEVLRKYNQRKKRHGTGSRGTSCSSSDASDTDDTEGRSRKDKHKFIHRRDSSDHSSDTDGGPSGPSGGLGGGRGMTGSGGGGRGGSNRDRKGGGGGSGGGSGSGGKSHKDGKHGGGKRQHYALKSSTEDIAVTSDLSNVSLTSVKSKNSLKYIVEKNESDSDIEDERIIIHKMNNDRMNMEKSNKSNNSISKDFNKLSVEENKAAKEEQNEIICSSDCRLNGYKNGFSQKMKVKVDINKNGFCKVQNCHFEPIKIETKCCSLV